MIKIILLAFILSGCAGFKDKFCDYQVIPPKEPIAISKEVFEPCAPLVIPTLPLTPESILHNQALNKVIYNACAIKNNASIVLIKKLSNN